MVPQLAWNVICADVPIREGAESALRRLQNSASLRPGLDLSELLTRDEQWHTSDELSVVDGTTRMDDIGALPAAYVLPREVRIWVHTGGGCAFGWEKAAFLVR